MTGNIEGSPLIEAIYKDEHLKAAIEHANNIEIVEQKGHYIFEINDQDAKSYRRFLKIVNDLVKQGKFSVTLTQSTTLANTSLLYKRRLGLHSAMSHCEMLQTLARVKEYQGDLHSRPNSPERDKSRYKLVVSQAIRDDDYPSVSLEIRNWTGIHVFTIVAT